MKHVTVPCWKPRGLSLGDEIRSFFLGSSTHLTNDSIVFDDAWQNRHQMLTTHIGHVRTQFQIHTHGHFIIRLCIDNDHLFFYLGFNSYIYNNAILSY